MGADLSSFPRVCTNPEGDRRCGRSIMRGLSFGATLREIVAAPLDQSLMLKLTQQIRRTPRARLRNGYHPRDPGEARTPDLEIRSHMLYPTELRGQNNHQLYHVATAP